MSETTQGADEVSRAPSQVVNVPANEIGHSSLKLIGFGADGAKEYERIKDEYSVSLEELSRVIARKRKSEVVSPFDVQTASVSLGGSPDRKFRHLSELGTLFIGAGLSYLGSVVYGSSYTFGNALLVFLPLLIGCILYAFSWKS